MSNTLRSKLVHFKPREPIINKNVIYNIPCECGHSYIDETRRTLETRVREHKQSLQKRDPDISKLAEHHYTTGHRIKWEETSVIGRETNWRARKVHEAAAIMKGGAEVFSTPSVEIDRIWKPVIMEMSFLPKQKKYGPLT